MSSRGGLEDKTRRHEQSDLSGQDSSLIAQSQSIIKERHLSALNESRLGELGKVFHLALSTAK